MASHSRHINRIDLKLREISQLFNSMDPSPFNERDLDSDAEEFIESWAQEFPPDEPVRLRVHLEHAPSDEPTALITEAIHNYYSYRRNLTRLELRRLMRQGRMSLLIGLAFLAACLSASQLLSTLPYPGLSFLRESLTIGGWVAMWRPMEIYLYDWWPVRRRGKIYQKLSQMPVEVVVKPNG